MTTIAGNLDLKTSSCIYEMTRNNRKLIVNLHSMGTVESKFTENIQYHGSFSPEDLIEKIEGKFALVWYGGIAECSGKMGKHLKYNPPQKTSFEKCEKMFQNIRRLSNNLKTEHFTQKLIQISFDDRSEDES
ncbi:hypothetical protein JEQ21_06375 [Streptococcus sp. 121]|uniref:hypothetical protein n=1 Tax=Streptococcus sp. 121 TaxID=2797637 RepID=UPI0018F0D0ED|nr:hypothetical protein [Streptococcus sp. 121]MBJ6746081.1 hypothetical protein [Streptococcus sp. 121]